jgi:hypothetical protein
MRVHHGFPPIQFLMQGIEVGIAGRAILEAFTLVRILRVYMQMPSAFRRVFLFS